MADLVALHLPPGPGFVAALRQVWEDGDAALPLDVRLPAPAVARLLDRLAPARVVGPDGSVSRRDGVPVATGDALVMATSGTTGDPKGVVLTHDAVAASARATSDRLGVDPARHHWLACLPLAHVGGLAVVTRALATGTPLTVLDRFDVDAVVAAATAGCTHTSMVPTTLARIDPASFEWIIVGGAAPPAVVPPNCSITYGLTETGSGCVYDHVPLDGVEIRVVDGEIQLRGPMLLRAYRSGGEEWSPLVDGGWFPTGDEGTFDAGRRWLEVFGRRGDLIITGGQNVWPEPVERLLGAVAGVAEVAVVGRPHPEWGQVVTAVVVPTSRSSPPVLAALRAAALAELAPYCAPHQLELVETLPRTALGKVQRNKL